MQNARFFLLAGSANMMLAVMFGAFAAHALKSRISEHMLSIFHTGVEYHFYHALGLLVVGILMLHQSQSPDFFKWSGWLMLSGIFLFSGSLYILSISGIRWLGMITPVGGTMFIAAWLVLISGILKIKF